MYLAALLAALLGSAADPPRVAVSDPAENAANAPNSFFYQGEYEGTLTEGGKGRKAGVQVVAGTDRTYTGRVFRGGLPGAGADAGKPAFTFTGAESGDVVILGGPNFTLKGPFDSLAFQGTGGLDAAGAFRRVERKSPTLGAKPPAGAVVLYAGPADAANWVGGKVTKLSDGGFLAAGCKSNRAFGAFTAHVEFRLPWMPNSEGQGRGNSGVYLQDRYEVQVLDSFGLAGADNECGGVYTLHKPKVNMCLPPLVWQTYDITFSPPRFDAAGKKTAAARLTLKHNGVTVHDDVGLERATGGGQPEGPAPGPLQLQDHGDPVVYRNVWVVPGK